MDRLTNSSVLVTGAAGFIGHCLMNKLVEQKNLVNIITRHSIMLPIKVK